MEESNSPARQSRYNAHAVRRCVRRVAAVPGAVVFASKSMTDATDNADRYHPVIDIETGAAWCDCPHYQYRLASLAPNVSRPETLCKHLQRGAENCRRRGELQEPPRPEDFDEPAEMTQAERVEAMGYDDFADLLSDTFDTWS